MTAPLSMSPGDVAGQGLGDASAGAPARATSPDGPQPPSASSRSGVPIAAVVARMSSIHQSCTWPSSRSETAAALGEYVSENAAAIIHALKCMEEAADEGAALSEGQAACNSHDELLEALEEAERVLEERRPFEDIEACLAFREDRTVQDELLYESRLQIRRAITKARGQ